MKEPGEESLGSASPREHPVSMKPPIGSSGWKAASDQLGDLAAKLIETIGKRVLDAADEVTALVLAILSIAFVYWVCSKAFPLAGIEFGSNESIVIRFVLLGVEIALILDFLRRRIKKE